MLLCSIVLFVGCESKEQEPLYLELSEHEIGIDYWGSAVTVKISCNGDWKIEGESEWCAVSQTQGHGTTKVTFRSHTSIDDGEIRRAKYVVRCGSIEKQIDVKQVCKGISLKDNVIVYESSKKIELKGDFGANIIEHTFAEGKNEFRVTFDGPVTQIPDEAFIKSVNAITIPETVTKIGAKAFSNCAFSQFEVPKGVTEIGEWAFANCTRLREITIPEKVTEIKTETFVNCTVLKSVNLHENITKIGQKAFGYCGALEQINLGDKITEIGIEAFYYCTALKSVHIPTSLTRLSRSVFLCSGIECVVIPDNTYRRAVF